MTHLSSSLLLFSVTLFYLFFRVAIPTGGSPGSTQGEWANRASNALAVPLFGSLLILLSIVFPQQVVLLAAVALDFGLAYVTHHSLATQRTHKKNLDEKSAWFCFLANGCLPSILHFLFMHDLDITLNLHWMYLAATVLWHEFVDVNCWGGIFGRRPLFDSSWLVENISSVAISLLFAVTVAIEFTKEPHSV